MKRNLIFKDLWDYIKGAERDSVGMHFPFEKTSNNPPMYAFHIYDNRRQVNICRRSDDSNQMNSIANFIFEGDEVCMVYVDSRVCVADYDYPMYFHISTPIDNPSGYEMDTNQIYVWKAHLGKLADVIQEVLRDTLYPVVFKQ